MTHIHMPDRNFQLWAFRVDMSRLLLRSPKAEGASTRIDILFQNVKAIQLPTLLRGLTVSSPDAADLRYIVETTGLLPDEDGQPFVLTGASYKGYVVAGVCAQAEDEGEYYEPSGLWPDT